MTKDKKLTRKTDDKMIAGVAAGIADYFGLDVTLVRVVLVVTAIMGGFGFVLYVVMWVLVPEEGANGATIVDLDPDTEHLKEE